MCILLSFPYITIYSTVSPGPPSSFKTVCEFEFANHICDEISVCPVLQSETVDDRKMYGLTCSFCDYTCGQNRSLLNHLLKRHRKFSPDSVHWCPVNTDCDFVSVRVGELSRHCLRQHGITVPFVLKCDNCSGASCKTTFRCPDSAALTSHLWEVHGEGSGLLHTCTSCDNSFRSARRLKSHGTICQFAV
jgi:hypothetical protein